MFLASIPVAFLSPPPPKARVLAARRGTSISGLVARELEELVAREARYEQARQRAVEIMAASVPRGRPTWRRDELHER